MDCESPACEDGRPRACRVIDPGDAQRTAKICHTQRRRRPGDEEDHDREIRRRNRRLEGPRPRLPAARSPSCSGPASALSPTRRSERPRSPTPRSPVSHSPPSRATPGGSSSARSRAIGSRCSRAAATITSAATPTRCASPIETFRALGGETLLLTNAAGGLHKEWRPPALVADHRPHQLLRHQSADRRDRRRRASCR